MVKCKCTVRERKKFIILWANGGYLIPFLPFKRRHQYFCSSPKPPASWIKQHGTATSAVFFRKLPFQFASVQNLQGDFCIIFALVILQFYLQGQKLFLCKQIRQLKCANKVFRSSQHLFCILTPAIWIDLHGTAGGRGKLAPFQEAAGRSRKGSLCA